MKTDKLLHLLQQKKFMRSGGALPLPKAQIGKITDPYIGMRKFYDDAYNALDKYENKQGEVSPFNVNRAWAKAAIKNPHLLFRDRHSLSEQGFSEDQITSAAENPYHKDSPVIRMSDTETRYQHPTDYVVPNEKDVERYNRYVVNKNNKKSSSNFDLSDEWRDIKKGVRNISRDVRHFIGKEIPRALRNCVNGDCYEFHQQGGLAKAQVGSSVDFRVGPTVAKAKSLAQQTPFPVTLPNTAVQYINFQDNRVMDPVVKGKKIESTRRNNIDNVERDKINKIIEQAKVVGVDPATLLTNIIWETRAGETDDNWGHNLYDETPTIEGLDSNSEKANIAAQGLLRQLNLGKKKYPQGPSYKQLQAYQGYGPLYPDTEKRYYKTENQAFYGIPVTKEKPLLTNKLFPYGKTIEQFRDSVVRPTLDKYGINYKQTGGLAKAQKGIPSVATANQQAIQNAGTPYLNRAMVQAVLANASQPVTNTLGRVISTPESREKERREKFIEENPNKYSIEDYKRGIKEPGLEESVSPLDFLGGVRGGMGLIKGAMKYRHAIKPNYIQIGDNLIDIGFHPKTVRRATNQMHEGLRNLVLPNIFQNGGVTYKVKINKPK